MPETEIKVTIPEKAPEPLTVPTVNQNPEVITLAVEAGRTAEKAEATAEEVETLKSQVSQQGAEIENLRRNLSETQIAASQQIAEASSISEAEAEIQESESAGVLVVETPPIQETAPMTEQKEIRKRGLLSLILFGK